MDINYTKWDKAQKIVGTLAPIFSLCIVIAWYSYLLYKDKKAQTQVSSTTEKKDDVPSIMP